MNKSDKFAFKDFLIGINQQITADLFTFTKVIFKKNLISHAMESNQVSVSENLTSLSH